MLLAYQPGAIRLVLLPNCPGKLSSYVAYCPNFFCMSCGTCGYPLQVDASSGTHSLRLLGPLPQLLPGVHARHGGMCYTSSRSGAAASQGSSKAGTSNEKREMSADPQYARKRPARELVQYILQRVSAGSAWIRRPPARLPACALPACLLSAALKVPGATRLLLSCSPALLPPTRPFMTSQPILLPACTLVCLQIVFTVTKSRVIATALKHFAAASATGKQLQPIDVLKGYVFDPTMMPEDKQVGCWGACSSVWRRCLLAA